MTHLMTFIPNLGAYLRLRQFFSFSLLPLDIGLGDDGQRENVPGSNVSFVLVELAAAPNASATSPGEHTSK